MAKSGYSLIFNERLKQIIKHGYSVKHDLQYHNKELLFGALAYLNTAIYDASVGICDWPFENEFFKDEGYIESLSKAGAFIIAELDRIQKN